MVNLSSPCCGGHQREGGRVGREWEEVEVEEGEEYKEEEEGGIFNLIHL